MNGENHEQTGGGHITRDSAIGTNFVKYLKKNQLTIAFILWSFGGPYQIFNWMGLIWYTGGTYDFIKGLTLQQEFTLHWGFLAAPLFIRSILSLIIGFALIWTDKS
jgi:hypothetical protein